MRPWALILAGALAGCASPQTRQVGSLMESAIVPASDAIFGAVIYANGQLVSAPTTDADWTRLQAHARNLISAADRLRTLAPSDDPGQWTRQSDALNDASTDALDAMNRRHLEGVLDAGSRIYDTCTTCHTAYVKDN